MDTRRKFFENYAKDHSFDPHVPDCWYSQSIDSILQIKVYILLLYPSNPFSFPFSLLILRV